MATQDDNTILSKADLKAYHQKILPFLGGNAFLSTSHSDYYSTEEKMIGVWTDGKPLYQKTYIGTTPSNFSPTSSYTITLGLGANSYTICRTFGSCNNANRVYVPLHYTNTAGGNVYYFDAYGVNSRDELVFVGTDNYASCNYAVTVQYTKDSDTATTALTTPGAYDLNRPDLWPANKEIFFGDGLYGQRFTGTITSNGAATDLNVTVSSIINEGGQISFPNWVAAPAPFGITATNGNSAWGMIFKANSNSNLNINAWYFEGSTTATYDIWVTYTK